MNEVAIHSTPIVVNQNKKSDDDNMLTRLHNMMYNSLEKQDACITLKKNKIAILEN